jgi:hypothetical protein
MDDRKVKLGDVARDTITGFEGVVVAITKWLHGCYRITIQPQKLHDGKPVDNCTFDEPQVEKVAPEVHESTARTGGPTPEPARKRDVR